MVMKLKEETRAHWGCRDSENNRFIRVYLLILEIGR
jgi:hypothetical protein